MLKIGIMGLGNSGAEHLMAYRDLEKGQVAAVCDIDPGKLDRAKKIYPDCKTFSSPEDFLDSGIQVIDLCVPCYQNYEIIKDIVSRDKHVLCDVPLSDNLDDAIRIQEITRKSESRLMASRIPDYSSNYNVFKNILDRKKIGEPGFLRISLGGGYPSSYRDWLDDDSLGGGVVFNLGVNIFYYTARIFGKAERVFARRKKIIEGENKKDYALIIIRFQDDNIVHAELSWAYPDGTPYILKMDAFGTNGQIWYDDSLRRPIRVYDSRKKTREYSLYDFNNPLAGNPYLLQMEDFLGAIENDTEIAGPEDDIYALEIARACLESAGKDSVVSL